MADENYLIIGQSKSQAIYFAIKNRLDKFKYSYVHSSREIVGMSEGTLILLPFCWQNPKFNEICSVLEFLFHNFKQIKFIIIDERMILPNLETGQIP